METAKNKVMENITQKIEKMESYLEYIQSEIEAMRTDEVVEKYCQSSIAAFGFIASRGGLFDRCDIWIEFFKGWFYLVMCLIIASLMFFPTYIVSRICRCLLRNFIRRINQLRSKESIVINSFKLFLLIWCVFFNMILWYTFFFFYYFPCKYLLTKGKTNFINIFNMCIPFA